MATQTKYTGTTGANTIDESVRRAKVLAKASTPAVVALGVMSEPGSADYTYSDTFVQGAPPGTPGAQTLLDNDASLQRSALTENRRNVIEMTAYESAVRHDVGQPGAVVGNVSKYETQAGINEARIYQLIEQRICGNTSSKKATGDNSGLAGSPATFASHAYLNWTAGPNSGTFVAQTGYNDTTFLSAKVSDAAPGSGSPARQGLDIPTILKTVNRIHRQTGQSSMGRSGRFGAESARYVVTVPQHILDNLLGASGDSFTSLNRINTRMEGIGMKGAPIVAHATMIKGQNLSIMIIGNSLYGGDDDATASGANAPRNQIGLAILGGCTSVVMARYPTSRKVTKGAAFDIAATHAIWSIKPPLGSLAVGVVGLTSEA